MVVRKIEISALGILLDQTSLALPGGAKKNVGSTVSKSKAQACGATARAAAVETLFKVSCNSWCY